MKRVSLLTVYLCLVYICLLSTATAEMDDTESQEESSSSSFSLAAGIGASWLLDDPINFKSPEDALLIEMDSRFRSVFFTGGLFYIKPTFKKYPLLGWFDDLLLSVAFTYGTSQTNIDGFVLGLSKRVTKELNFVMGYTLGRGTELSPGFQARAHELIKQYHCDSRYARFRKFEPNGKREMLKILDGFPLVDPKNDKKFFPGDPVISSFNHALYIGLVMPFELKLMTKSR